MPELEHLIDAEALRALCEIHGGKVEVIAKESGVSARTLVGYRNGRVRKDGTPAAASLENIKKLAIFFNVEVAELVLTRPSGTPDETALEPLRSELRELLAHGAAAATRHGLRQLVQSPLLGTSESGTRLRSRALAQLALMEQGHASRRRLRLEAISTLEKAQEPISIVSYANRVVDFVYEFGSTHGSRTTCGKLVRHALKRLADVGEELAQRGDAIPLHVMVLTQAASLHRCALPTLPHRERGRRVGTALRCARKAWAIGVGEPIAALALGQSEHLAVTYLGRASEADLDQAEEHLVLASEAGLPFAHLVRARFFRRTDRHREAVGAFLDFEETVPRRDVLAESGVVAEAAIRLWRRDHAEARDAVEYAHALVGEAVAAGYEDARKIIALATMTAILDGPKAAEAQLARLSLHRKPWIEAVRAAIEYANAGNVDGLRDAFCFGLDAGSHWSALATFVRDFLGDAVTALELNDVAARLAPNDQVVLLNHARLLAARGSNDEALLFARRAAECADHFFHRYVDDFFRSQGWRAPRFHPATSGPVTGGQS